MARSPSPSAATRPRSRSWEPWIHEPFGFAGDPHLHLAGVRAERVPGPRPLERVLLTHAHLDHIEGVAEIVRRTGAPVYLHPDDRALYGAAADQAAMFGMRIEPLPPVDRELVPGQDLEMAGCRFQVRFAPGH